MSAKRHSALMMMVLAVCGQTQAVDSVQPSTNSISHLQIKPGEEDWWVVDFDYTYTGEPPGAVFHIDLTLQAGKDTADFHGPRLEVLPQPGAHHVQTSYQFSSPGMSRQLIVTLTNAAWSNPEVLASDRVDRVITWPTWEQRNYREAVHLIDNGHAEPLNQARQMLEELIRKNPKFDPAFVELARIAMRTNWGPEGLHQAETLLNSARDIRPDSIDAKILLGYVYAHQHRLHDAEVLFVEAARSNPPNAWLWVNWGELLEMQGKPDQASVKYREALTRKGSLLASRARENAFDHLLSLLDVRKDADEIEGLYKQGNEEFGPGSCYNVDYARFKLNVRSDAQGAIDLAQGLLSQTCADTAREILGLASYALWGQVKGEPRGTALNQARIYLPVGPTALYLLANNDVTMPAAKKLIAAGEAIDQKDNEQMTALAYALRKDRLDAAARLLQLGARPETPVGIEGMPAALLPVVGDNLEAVRVLQRAGVDYSNLRYRGATAVDLARQMEDPALLKALTAKDRTL